MATDLEDKPGSQNDGYTPGSHDDLGVNPADRKAEIANLEESFGAPSAPDPEKKDSAEELEEKEEDAGDVIGEGYQEERRFRIRGLTRRRAAAGGVAGVVVGGVLFLFSVSSGPLQFIHIGQLLQRFHFASMQDTGDSRLLKIFRYSKNLKKGTVENTRLGIAGRKVIVNLDAKFKTSGIEKKYSTLGTYEGTSIKLDDFEANARNGDQLGSLRGQDAADWFQENYKIKVDVVSDGELITKDDGFLNYFKNRKVNLMLAKETGESKIPASLLARIMGKRDAATFHPIRAVDKKIAGALDKRLTAFFSFLKNYFSKGEIDPVSATGKAVNDKSGNPDNTATKSNEDGASSTNDASKGAKGAVDDADGNIKQGVKSSTDDVGAGYIKRFTDSKTGSGVLKGTAVVGLACAAKGIANAADDLKHDLVVLPLIRMGVQAMTLGNQVMSGQDISADQLGLFSRLLTNNAGQSWTLARSIQAELGQPLTGPDISDAANIAKIQAGNMFSRFFNAIPGLDTVCSAISSGIGSLAVTVLGVVTAPVGTIGGEILAQSGALDEVIGSVVRWMAGSPLPTVVFGPEYGNFFNMGAKLAANDSFAAVGGVPLSPTQAAELKNGQLASERQEFASKPLVDKLFDPYSPDSVIAKVIDNSSSSPSENVAKMFGGLLNPVKVLQGSFGSMFNKRVNALSGGYTYPFGTIGFNQNELSSSTYEDPFANAETVLNILKRPSASKYIDRAKHCFGVQLGADGAVNNLLDKLDITKKGFYDSSKSSKNCSDQTTDWTRVRFYILDTKLTEAADCFESGDPQSCSDSGFGTGSSSLDNTATTTANSSIVGDPYQSSAKINCAQGTVDLGVHSAYASGVQIKNRLCALTNLSSSSEESTPGSKWYVKNPDTGVGADGKAIVNSRVSGAWFALVSAAKTANVNLGANSSFRTMEHQQQLWDGAGHDSSRVARPGFSSHQAGVAIDFANMGPYHASSGATCDNRQTRFGNAGWDWLNNNAYKFGFKQYAAEAWHWDAYPSANRCGPDISQTNPTTGPVRRF